MRYSVWVFTKKDVRPEIRTKFPDDDGSGYNFISHLFDMSYSRSTKARAIDLALRIKKSFPKTTVDVCDNGDPFIRNGKPFKFKRRK